MNFLGHLASKRQVSFAQAAHLLKSADIDGSSDPDATVAGLLANNRAGPGESRLTVDEIVRQYRKPD
jgi:hypothetical protein